MMTIIKSSQASLKINNADWSFLPNILSGVGGIILGWAIAVVLGWT